MIRAVIFDFNGILVDDEPLHFELFQEVLAEEGVRITEKDYRDIYLGYDDRRCLEEALRNSGKPHTVAIVQELVERKADRYREQAAAGLRYFPGAADCVSALARRWHVAINSGALLAEIELALEQMRLREAIAAIVSAEDTAECKPDPEGYLLALDALRTVGSEDLEAGHCLVVEDSLAGVEAGKSAGMWVVGVTNTYTEGELRQAGADVVLSSLEQLTPGMVERWFQPEVSP